MKLAAGAHSPLIFVASGKPPANAIITRVKQSQHCISRRIKYTQCKLQDSGVTKGTEREQLPPGEGRKTASPKYFEINDHKSVHDRICLMGQE